MKLALVLAGMAVLGCTVSSLEAGEVILFGELRKPGEISYSSGGDNPEEPIEGKWGGGYGIRFSGVRAISYEQKLSYSPKFARDGVKAFQFDSNLLLQAPGKVAPYLTTGVGFIRTWGPEYPDDGDSEKLKAQAFNFGKKFAINYGAGIKLRRIAGALGINVDFRRYTVTSVHDGSLGFTQVSLGAMLTW